jgi:O-antigen biosynthesis protein
MKYDFDLDMNSLNSNSVILKNIQQHSNVLEIGCAQGRMTRYLHSVLNCTVNVVETEFLSEDLRKYVNTYFDGPEFGNIEKDYWHCSPNIKNMDYVILADVLEHLHNPQKVLENIKKVLKPNGSVWISVPNISHNAVLIDLLQNKFQYRDYGLLDKTHIHFFTRNSLTSMVIDAGFKVNNMIDLINQLECCEFNNSYEQLPCCISDYLKNKPDGEVYQFVWELKL